MSVRTRSRRLISLAGAACIVASGLLAAAPAQAEQGAMIMPTSGRITGTPNGYCGSGSAHGGFDIAAPTGTKVIAAASGTVTVSGTASRPGSYVVVEHAGGWQTRYLHLSRRDVTVGQKVSKGQTLGAVGSTGNSTGPHLHFTVQRNGTVIKDASLIDDFRCGTTVSSTAVISYSFPGLPGGSATTPSPSTGTYPTLRSGDRGEAVTRLQNLLAARGYSPGTIDGSFGPNTDRAVRSFQSAIGTGVDGVVGPKTWGALEARAASGATLANGSTGADVTALQKALNATRGANLTVDGRFGPATDQAVRGYQSSRSLSVDGRVGPSTWNALKNGR